MLHCTIYHTLIQFLYLPYLQLPTKDTSHEMGESYFRHDEIEAYYVVRAFFVKHILKNTPAEHITPNESRKDGNADPLI